METPLNKAHFYARKSLHYSGPHKIKYIEQAVENFKIALTKSSNPKAIDSIKLQIDYYEKQLKLLSLKRALYLKSEKQISNKTNTDNDDYDESVTMTINEHVEKATDIQLDLLRNLEESYKIIEELNTINNPEILSQVSQLQNLNSQLNLMFHKLSVSMDAVLCENVLLRDKSNDSKTTATCNINRKDESKKNYETTEQRDSDDSSPNEDIQELPPLELPSFNLDVLDNK